MDRFAQGSESLLTAVDVSEGGSEGRRVETDPEILAGKPVVKGTRVPVHIILELLGGGYTTEQVIDEYPQLEEEDVQAAIRYASRVIGSTEWVDFGVA